MSRQLAEGEPAESTLHLMEEEVGNLLKTPGWSARRDRLCGVGVAAPGPVDLTTGTIVGPPNFPSWEHVNVVKELGEAFGLPVLIDNAATAATIGVGWRLPHDHGPYLYCYWGIGIGGGLVIGDDVYRGTTGNAIEIGHVVVNPGGRPCECGGVGCLETEASVSALCATPPLRQVPHLDGRDGGGPDDARGRSARHRGGREDGRRPGQCPQCGGRRRGRPGWRASRGGRGGVPPGHSRPGRAPFVPQKDRLPHG